MKIHLLPFLVVGLANPAVAATSPARPNIVFILADDMGIADPTCYGGKGAPTPRLDQLAREGTRFTQYYSASPICSASRTGLTTGMYPARWRITSYLSSRKYNRDCGQADFLDAQAPSVARALKAAGYSTGHFGKWHMGGGRDVTDAPKFAAYGFDEGAGTWESPEPHPDITSSNWIWAPTDKVKRWDRTAFFVEKALDFLTRHKNEPCFVQIWPDDVHTPWVPDDNWDETNTPKNLHPVLHEMDTQIGRFLDGLQALGLADNTLVVFASDNGPEPTFDGLRAGGFRGGKWSLYEGGIRLPLIVRWPGHVPANRVDRDTVCDAVDLLPTLCAVSGAALPTTARLDGIDLSPALLGRAAVSRPGPLFWEYGRTAKFFKYPPDPKSHSPNVAVRDGTWKLLINADGTRAELYDLVADPAESKNLAGAQPAVARRLTDAALAWRRALP